MDFNLTLALYQVPHNSCEATKRVMELLIHRICPVLQRLRSKLDSCMSDFDTENEFVKIKNVYMLCSSQIKKCIVNFIDIIKMENKKDLHMKESRQFIYERLSWCITKLLAVENSFDEFKLKENIRKDFSDDPIFATPMYFVNWIDYTFELLAKLADEVYRTDYKSDDSLHEEWKGNMVEHVTSLHMTIDELLLSAMTLCRYCLPDDQVILRARCQVVLREMRSLFCELINEDISTAIKITKEKLKLPIMPSNVNMMIDVLKDVLYVLETNTNTALLALLIHCYVNCVSPVDVVQDHFSDVAFDKCPCRNTTFGDIEDCEIVKNFDLYNERLQQIGSFAVSCSSDQKRILKLRSCLSSLESLDPHLVPTLTTSPRGDHTEVLMNIWKQEVLEIRDTVFLIVDPIAFVEKCKEYMHDLLLEMKVNECEDTRDLWVVMSTGRMVHDFFTVYKKYEPEAIAHHDTLDQLLNDIQRVQKECKTVSEYLTQKGTFLYDAQNNGLQRRGVTIQTLLQRVKLLYSLVKKIHKLISPKDNDEQFFDEDVANNKNVTHTICKVINTDTYTNCPKKTETYCTRSVFARSGVQTSENNVFLSKLTQHLKLKKDAQDELSFSAQVSALFSAEKSNNVNMRRPESPPQLTKKYSLRKMLMHKHSDFPFMKKIDSFYKDNNEDGNGTQNHQECVFEGSESLQISEILHQINDLTCTVSTTPEEKSSYVQDEKKNESADKNISGETSEGSTSLMSASYGSQPSDFTTFERLSDLDLVESKLNSLRAEFETHL